MSNELKTRKRLSSTINIDLVYTLHEYSNKTKIPQSKLLDMALETYFKANKIKIKKYAIK